MRTLIGTELVKVQALYESMRTIAYGLTIKENDGHYWESIDLEDTVVLCQGIKTLSECVDLLLQDQHDGVAIPKEISYMSEIVSQLNVIWNNVKLDRKLKRKTVKRIHKVLETDKAKALSEFLYNIKSIVNKNKGEKR